MGQEWLGPSYFFISLVIGPLNSLVSVKRDLAEILCIKDIKDHVSVKRDLVSVKRDLAEILCIRDIKDHMLDI